MSTRSSNKVLAVLSESPGPQHLKITGAKLPTYEQVLLCILAHKNHVEPPHRRKGITAATNAAAKEIILQYTKANIKTVSEARLCYKLKSLFRDYNNVQALPKNRTKSIIKTLFKEKLKKTYPAWPQDIID